MTKKIRKNASRKKRTLLKSKSEKMDVTKNKFENMHDIKKQIRKYALYKTSARKKCTLTKRS